MGKIGSLGDKGCQKRGHFPKNGHIRKPGETQTTRMDQFGLHLIPNGSNGSNPKV